MARGNGKQSQVAQKSGKLSAFVRPKAERDAAAGVPDWVDWGEVNQFYMVGAVKAAVKEGGALLFGASRDKTCYSVKVYSGGDGEAYYFPCTPNGVEELEAFLLAIAELAND